MDVDYLIIGQGISGTWLSYYLQKEKKSFLVIDNYSADAPSRVAAGVINPVTGRRHVQVWLADELLPFSWDAYTQISAELHITAISQQNIIDFFPSPQMRMSFLDRVGDNDPYVHSYPEQNHFNHFFNYDFGCGEIRPCYTVNLESFLPAWRQVLQNLGQLLEEDFTIDKLVVGKDHIMYKDIRADKIIFCDGPGSGRNPFFNLLPFAPNKGEALIVDIPGLPVHHIFKKGIMMVPMAMAGRWWIGSSYEWEFSNTGPTVDFRNRTEAHLKSWLKIPFTITDHVAGIRPATLERRPFVGMHPVHPLVGILNGMGTKGCSLAPYFAKQLADHLLYHLPILPGADISRFSKMLSRGE